MANVLGPGLSAQLCLGHAYDYNPSQSENNESKSVPACDRICGNTNVTAQRQENNARGCQANQDSVARVLFQDHIEAMRHGWQLNNIVRDQASRIRGAARQVALSLRLCCA